MSRYSTKGEVFAAIREDSRKTGIMDGAFFKHWNWVQKQIEEAKKQYPFMQNTTADEYMDYHSNRFRHEFVSIDTQPVPTNEQFWKAAYDYDPLGSSPSAVANDLQRMIASGRLQPLPLGKVYGQTLLKLIPTIGALPAASIPGLKTPYNLAATDSAAISYPDGHPTRRMLSQPPQVASPSRQVTTPSERKPELQYPSPPRPSPTRTASEQRLLRRSRELATSEIKLASERISVPQDTQENSEGRWEKTGHVLVIDMDDRAVRHRQPWLILASEWPTDGDETVEGTFTHYAEEDVQRGDNSVAGVFPGNENRTPICCIRPKRESRDDEIVLKQFGEDFDFVPVRLGGHRETKKSFKGPGLARVMEWYWDPEAKQEVCYTKGGLEYMRYDRSTEEYSYPEFSRVSFAGEEGLFGELQESTNP
ncbi:MAG: hypothetical protein Q9166_001970 [cf. Caloplaca sp. 2 TL-2023]